MFTNVARSTYTPKVMAAAPSARVLEKARNTITIEGMKTTPLVLMLQLHVPNNAATNVPLAAGYLKAYAHSLGLLEQIAIEFVPRALADHAGDAMLVEYIVAQAPCMLALSLYTWNSERSLGIAEQARRRLPELVVVVGGPEVQHDNLWVVEHSAVDVAVVGEGEQTFAELLQHMAAQYRQGAGTLAAGALAAIPGIIFRDGTQRHTTPERVALADLAVVPSPYLLGYLDVAPGAMLMVEVSRWCPYACSFCLYGRNMG
ncbi:MAG TPA: cobalamin-dependent protein, partial [Roseiflexaceae bacterium]|nr:cobalamin-dependent protein [Roseiflexaceae bacterium]